jgi:hypothetical protein
MRHLGDFPLYFSSWNIVKFTLKIIFDSNLSAKIFIEICSVYLPKFKIKELWKKNFKNNHPDYEVHAAIVGAHQQIGTDHNEHEHLHFSLIPVRIIKKILFKKDCSIF